MSSSWKLPFRDRAVVVLLALGTLLAYSDQIAAQGSRDSEAIARLTWSTDSIGPRRFVSVHGRRAAIFGYSEDGLEVWAYPVEILSSYGVTFREPGATTGMDGQTLLRRIIYSPAAVTRIYAGPDFIIREKLFVPLEEPGAVIRYEVESSHPVDIEIRFTPVLDLMWPASIGGQEVVWNSAASAYLLFEATHRVTASIASPDIVAHDETPNDRQYVQRLPGLAFTVRAGGDHKTAQVMIAEGQSGQDAITTSRKLLEEGGRLKLEEAAAGHYLSLVDHSLQIETPDADTNRALAWAEIALDQAWVSNPDLGSGQVAGYGPSRRARRPQYDWFFAGDGMVAIPALLAAGQYDRARQELEFILKYQDPKNGMIWHELAQSAGWLDWSKYPYMFVHVELTFDFLNTVGAYVSVTGDRGFVKAHWPSIQAAYRYCRSLLDAKDGLPRIPAGKEGAREQDPLTEELGLSASWVEAAQAFASLATISGHPDVAAGATADSRQASNAIGQRYWDDRENFWITGYNRSGAPVMGRDIGPVKLIGKSFFSEAQRNSIIDQLASSNFQADWGTRGRASSSSTYEPNSYASGSVWAVSTSSVASAFWTEHRPATAGPIWSALVPWSSLDSLGHMHEALAGDYYHEERESVPEQTWSSAAFFTAAVNGLLGLEVDGVSNRLTFAPHLPPSWQSIALRNLRVGASEISIEMTQSANEVRLDIENGGAPVDVIFDPEIPFGATVGSVQLASGRVAATLEQHPQDTHVKVEFHLPHGSSSLTIHYTGGIALILPPPELMIGEPSQAIKITGVNLRGNIYTLNFDYLPSAASSFDLRTPWIVTGSEGATFKALSPGTYRVTVSAPRGQSAEESHIYQHGTIRLTFAGEARD
jgi:glycogen debranching enzyme